MIQNVRWLGVSKAAVKEAAIKKVSRRLTKGKSQSYTDFCKALAAETGMTEAQTRATVKIFTAAEGLPNREEFHLLRKFEMTEGERCCYVRNPTPEELAAYNVGNMPSVGNETTT